MQHEVRSVISVYFCDNGLVEEITETHYFKSIASRNRFVRKLVFEQNR